MKFTRFALIGLALLTICHGQITIVDSGATSDQVNLAGTYNQSFDSLLATTPSSGAPWVNNVTLPGWYSNPSFYSASYTAVGILSLGVATDSDRALGSRGNSWALRFVNSSSQTITGFNVSYTGEQWYRGANDPQGASIMSFEYKKYSAATSAASEISNINGAGRISVPELYFNSPNQTDVSASILDGNTTENRLFVNFTLTGIAVAPGEKLWLRWASGSLLAQSHAIGIDDVQVSFISTIPEPASFASFAAAAALGIALIHRRRGRPLQ